MNKRYLLISSIGFGLTLLGGLAGFAVKALADGIPSPNPLYYSGTLTEEGQLVNGIRAITVNLYADGTTTTSLCQTIASNTPVTGGRFRIALTDACKTAINQNNSAYVEVIDGATSLGRSAMGAVPYAVEADRASGAAGTLATQIVPSGAVMAFNLNACPIGWSAFTSAQGRTIVGTNSDGDAGLSVRNLGDTIGEEQHTMLLSELVPHSHGEQVANLNGYAGADGVPGGDGNEGTYHSALTTDAAGGGQPFNIMQPSLVLLYCQKN